MSSEQFLYRAKVEAPILNHAQFSTVKIFQYKIFIFQYILGVVSSIIDY